MPAIKWYHKTSVLVVALLAVGPLALPLVWSNPRLSKTNKTLLTIAVLVLTYFLVLSTLASLKTLSEYYNQIF